MTRKEYILSVIWPALDFKFAISGPDGFKVADFQAELKKHGLPDPIVDDTRKWTKNPRDIFVTEKHLEITKAAEPLLEGKDRTHNDGLGLKAFQETATKMFDSLDAKELAALGERAAKANEDTPPLLRTLPTATAALLFLRRHRPLLHALPTATAAHLLHRLCPLLRRLPMATATLLLLRRRRPPPPRTPHGDSGAPASPLTPPPPAPPPAKKARGRPRKTASVVGQKRKAEDERVEGEPVVAAKRQKNPVTPRSRTTRATAGPRTPSPAPIQGRMINCFFYPIGAILPVDYAWEDEYKPVWRKPARALALYD
ncbi:hypothetical protein B0H17DRAFT_1299588 [Mycena rosella]|uniref:Uncharacterized protein n=1 Tax=Mycena rosella TaxID=1033263 RepID=A0AAD7DF61_MYCRO|nr:hypothetical protein B0H17DRAFT_1299588 [Mycena rosella]